MSDDNNLFILPVTQWNNTACFASGHPEELMESDRRLPFAPGRFPALTAQQHLWYSLILTCSCKCLAVSYRQTEVFYQKRENGQLFSLKRNSYVKYSQ